MIGRSGVFARLACGVWALVLASCASSPHAVPANGSDALASWNDGPTKSSIVAFVESVTTPGASYVAPENRIAVFDNDGTLWTEQPAYSQLLFVVDRIHALAPEHPEWRDREPFQSILAGNLSQALAGGEHAIAELVMATHAGMTTEEFEAIVSRWMSVARHPTLKRPYDRCVYQPMLELLAYLRSNGFTTYIVSGGGVEFMRPWTERVYGIPPEQVVGSRIKLRYDVEGGKPVLRRLPDLDFIDDKSGKPIGIQQMIGRRPIAAFGNSDGDFEMLEWTTSGTGPRFGLLVHHTDGVREVAYDRDSKIGRLARGLDEAAARGWVVVDMKGDWRRVFPDG